jgi:hypothetical protein
VRQALFVHAVALWLALMYVGDRRRRGDPVSRDATIGMLAFEAVGCGAVWNYNRRIKRFWEQLGSG